VHIQGTFSDPTCKPHQLSHNNHRNPLWTIGSYKARLTLTLIFRICTHVNRTVDKTVNKPASGGGEDCTKAFEHVPRTNGFRYNLSADNSEITPTLGGVWVGWFTLALILILIVFILIRMLCILILILILMMCILILTLRSVVCGLVSTVGCIPELHSKTHTDTHTHKVHTHTYDVHTHTHTHNVQTHTHTHTTLGGVCVGCFKRWVVSPSCILTLTRILILILTLRSVVCV
jgi:hypothetical protein